MIHPVALTMEDTLRTKPSTMSGAKSSSTATLATYVMDLHGVFAKSTTIECTGVTHLLFASVSVMTALATSCHQEFYADMCIDIFIAIARCDKLDDPLYGNVKVYGYSHGSTAYYRCNSGYRLVGNAYRRCDNGIWAGKKPVCHSTLNLLIKTLAHPVYICKLV